MRDFFGEYLYRFYLVVLKLVLTIVPAIAVIMEVIQKFMIHPIHQRGVVGFIKILTFSITVTFFKVAVVCAIWVTIIFLVLKVFQIKIEPEKVEGLEHLVHRNKDNIKSISRLESIIELIGILFIIWILCLHPEVISIYRINEGELIAYPPLFNTNVLEFYHPLILSVYGFGILFTILKLLIGQWSIGLSIAHLIYKIGGFLLLSCMVINSGLFNEAFFAFLFPFTDFNLLDYWSNISYITIAVAGICTFFEIISPFSKIFKSL